jgi:deoxyribose-phosphate aldolase
MTQLIQEAKRMQFLAGLINESQMNEEDKAATEEKVQDTVEKAIDSPKAQATLQQMAAKLSDEDKQKYGDSWIDYIDKHKLTSKKSVQETFYLEISH